EHCYPTVKDAKVLTLHSRKLHRRSQSFPYCTASNQCGQEALRTQTGVGCYPSAQTGDISPSTIYSAPAPFEARCSSQSNPCCSLELSESKEALPAARNLKCA